MEINKLKEELKDFIEKNTEEVKITIADTKNVDLDSVRKYAYRATAKNLLESIEKTNNLVFKTEEILDNLLKEEEFDKALRFITLNTNVAYLLVYLPCEEGKILNLAFDDIRILEEFIKLYKIKYLGEIYKNL